MELMEYVKLVTAFVVSIGGSSVVIVALAKFFGGFISTRLLDSYNNKHEKEMFKKEFYEKRKCEVIENYLKCIGGIIFYNDYQNKASTAEYISEIYMYAPKEMWCEIDKINRLALNIAYRYGEDGYSKEAIKETYIDFCKKFSEFSREQVVIPKSKLQSLLSKLRRKKQA